jgi:FixJ family two-component response regulator
MTGIEVINFPGTVLVVDDEGVVLEVLGKVLALRGMQVQTVRTAEEALPIIETEGFGCLLTDKNLPGMNGIELIARMRKVQPHCACIVMTGYASTSSVIEALRLGAADYLEKPFQNLELVAEKVSRAIQNHRAQFERARLIEKLREFQAELTEKDGVVDQQSTEIRMFNEILEARVEQATRDLRWKIGEYEKAAKHRMPFENEVVGAEMALMLLEDIQLRPGPHYAAVRGELQRVVRQLKSHLKTLKGGGKAA